MNIKKFLNFKSILFASGIFAAIFATLVFSGKIPLFNKSQNQKLSGNVVVWGTVPSSSMLDFVDMFNKEAKTYTMKYIEVPYEQMNAKITSARANGQSPDLIIAPSDILLANVNWTQIIGLNDISESVFKGSFADIASVLFFPGVGSVGLPVSVDPLVLYYNKDLLSTNGFVNPPATWTDLYNYQAKLTKMNGLGGFSLSTIAFGTYDNIPHITDIILSMIFQQGGVPITNTFGMDSEGNRVTKYVVSLNDIDQKSGLSPLNSALAFTKDFSDSQKSTYNWNARSSNALNQFIAGNLAFYIGYASELGYIKGANQKLNVGLDYLPQISGSTVSATYGKLYTVFMLNTSPTPGLSYKVMKDLSFGPLASILTSVVGGSSPLKQNIVNAMSSGDRASEVFGNSVLISKNFPDLHRLETEALMREAIRQVYNGEKSTVDAAIYFTDKLQAVYNGEN